jgi:hypothetical protein
MSLQWVESGTYRIGAHGTLRRHSAVLPTRLIKGEIAHEARLYLDGLGKPLHRSPRHMGESLMIVVRKLVMR